MAQFYRPDAIAWLVLALLALPSLALFCLLLAHFRGILRSLDICLAGLVARNALYTLVAAPLLLSVVLGGAQWTLASCQLLVFSMHAPLLVSLVGTAFFAVDRMFLLRKEGGPIYNGWVTNKVKPLLLISAWSCAAFITGLVPVNLWTRVTVDSTDSSQVCHFLPSQLDFSYSMVACACNVASSVICAVCSVDGYLYLRRSRHPAQEMVTRIIGGGVGAGGDGGGGGGGSGGSGPASDDGASAESAKPGQLRRSAEFDARKHAWESWRVTSLVNAIVFACNHLPMLILDFSALVDRRQRSGSEYIILVLLESILMPNSLWLAAVRYRHVVHSCTIGFTRRSSKADDVYCAMQQFQKRCTLMGSVYRGQKKSATAANPVVPAESPAATEGSRAIQRVRVTSSAANPIFSLSPLGLNIRAPEGSATTTSNNGEDDSLDGRSGAEEAPSWLPISAGEVVRARVPPPLDTLPEDSDTGADGIWASRAATTAAGGFGGDFVQKFDDSFFIDAVIVSTRNGDGDSADNETEADAEEVETETVADSGRTSPGEEGGDDNETFYLSAADIKQIVVQRRQDSSASEENCAAEDSFYLSEAELQQITEQRRFQGNWAGDDLQRANAGFEDFAAVFVEASPQFEAPTAVALVVATAEPEDRLNQGNNFSQELDAYL